MSHEDEDYLDTLPRCSNCGCDIREHEKDSEPAWMCPMEYQPQSSYGFFNGGDPRDFHPCGEDCSPDELQRHKEACAEATRLEKNRNLPCPSGYERIGDTVVHILRAPFGIGVQTYPMMVYESGLGIVPADGQKELFQ